MKTLAIFAALAAIVAIPAASLGQTKPLPPGAAHSGMRPGMGMQGVAPGSPEWKKRMAEATKKRRAKLIKDLGMTAPQIKKLDALQKSEEAKRTKMMSQSHQPMDMQAMQKTFAKMRADHDAAMKKILSKAQWAKYQKMQAEERKRRAANPGIRNLRPPTAATKG
jgi:hypothetical protein